MTTAPVGYADLIQWTGGGPESQNGGATLTTKWPCIGNKTVTASLCDTNASKTVNVVLPPGCETGEKSVTLAIAKRLDPSCSSGECGTTQPPTDIVGRLNSRYNQCSWVFQVDAEGTSACNICPSNYTEIQGGDDSDVNSSNFCNLVAVFVQDGCKRVGGVGYANSACVQIHEDCHFNFITTELNPNQVNWLKARPSMEMAVNCSDPDSCGCGSALAARVADIRADIDRAYVNAWNYAKSQGEEPCDDAARPCNTEVAKSICNYAKSMGWPYCPGCGDLGISW